MADLALDAPVADAGVKVRRERPRMDSLKFDKLAVANRIQKFFDDDNQDRGEEIQNRLQRYAKYRMWTEGRDWPWPGATDFANPDMMTASMRVQDTLHNAVMSQRPPVMSKATKKHDESKTDTVDHLIDYQVFVEQPGEEIVGTLAHDFVNEGFYTAYVPWVKETRQVVDLYVMPAIPQGERPQDYFQAYLEGKFPRMEYKPTADWWDWTVIEGPKKKHRVSFFTREDGQVEVEIEHDAIRYEGPRIIPKDVQDVLHQARCENLQIPGPSNPLGAPHVIIKDYPTIDEIKRLSMGDHPFYDMVTDDELTKIGITRMNVQYQEREQQKDIMQGHSDSKEKPAELKSHAQLTRLMVFDCYDIDDDGVDEDVIWWYILETKTILRARYLTQMFPANPPIRPLAEAHLFPVPGRRYSIGLLEMMEGVHDLSKQFFDQGADAGTIANAPFGFYRATSNMRPEVLNMWPGELYPLSDPKNDIVFPQMGNTSQSFTFNMVSLLQQMEERLTNIGELQLGRVPQGKASALRTVSGMQTVLAQGDARPERVLRRFFLGLTQIWRICHTLNQAFLPKNKQFLITGYKEKQNDPYGMVDSPDKIAGNFMFDFSANALNTSKESMQSALQDLIGMYVSPLAIQMGIIKPEGIFRLFRDAGRARGQDPDKYLSPPTPNAYAPKIVFEEALAAIFEGQMPTGDPAEGAEVHLQKMQEFTQTDEFGLLDNQHVSILKMYMDRVAQAAMQERQQQALLQAAQQMQQQMQPPGKSGPPGQPHPGAQAQPPVQGNELLDESLPGAGGGANPVAA